MKKCGAYMLRCVGNGSVYIGSTRDLNKRFARHFNELKQGIHHNVKLQEQWNDDTEIEKWEFLTETREHAYQIEQALIDDYLPSGKLLNIGLSVRGGDNFTLHPEQDKIRLQITNTLHDRIAAMSPDERKAKYGKRGNLNGMFGRTHSEETRKILSEKGKKNVKQNQENGKRLGELMRTSVMREHMSALAKQRLGDKNPFFGKTHSNATKDKLRQKRLGKKPTNQRAVSIDGVIYQSATDAGRQLGRPTMTVLFRIKSKNPKFKDYRYVTEMPND